MANLCPLRLFWPVWLPVALAARGLTGAEVAIGIVVALLVASLLNSEC